MGKKQKPFFIINAVFKQIEQWKDMLYLNLNNEEFGSVRFQVYKL